MENRKMQTSADNGDKFADRRDPRLFVRAPKLIIYDKKISNAAKILYFILQDYGRNGKINVSVKRLAADMEVSTRQVRNILAELEDKNLIRRLPVFNSPNNIVLLSLRPQGVAPGDDRQPVQSDEPPSRRPEQRQRPPAPADAANKPTTGAATASTPTTAPESASRTSRADDQSSDADSLLEQAGRGEKYFRAEAPEESHRQDEPAGKRGFFFRQGVKLISAKEDDSKKNHVCKTQSADVSQNLLGNGKEGAGDYHLNQQRNLKPEQRTEGNSKNPPDNLGYVALCNFGIWEGKARRLAEIADRQHGDAADQFISSWIEETNRRKRVQDPCAYLSSAISDNWKLPAAHRASQSERRASRQPNATGSRSSRPSGAQRQRQLKPIDFNKYTNLAPAADECRDQDADRSATPGATVTLPVYRETDLYLKCALKDYRPDSAYLLDYAELTGDGVKVRFIGGRQPVDFEPVEWLRAIKVYYPTVNHVEVIRTY